VRRLLVAASVVPSSLILVTLIKEALGYSETSVLARTTQRNIPDEEIPILCSLRRLLVAASIVPISPILVTLIKEALGSSEKSVLKEPHDVTSQKTPFFMLNDVRPRFEPNPCRIRVQSRTCALHTVRSCCVDCID
jgi:hypothetical protein